MERVTTLPAPITLLRPIVTPGSRMEARRVRPRIDLHVGSDEDVVPDVDALVVDERAVHIDDHVVADKDVAAEFAMKINVEMNALSHVSEEFAHQALLFFAVVVLDVVQLPQKLSRPTDHSEKVGVLPADKGFACEALFVFRGHDSSLHLREHEATGEAPDGASFRSVYKSGASDRRRSVSLFRTNVPSHSVGGESVRSSHPGHAVLPIGPPRLFFRSFDEHQDPFRRTAGFFR